MGKNQGVWWALPACALPVLGLGILLGQQAARNVSLFHFVFCLLEIIVFIAWFPVSWKPLVLYVLPVLLCVCAWVCVLSGRTVNLVPVFHLISKWKAASFILNAVWCSLVHILHRSGTLCHTDRHLGVYLVLLLLAVSLWTFLYMVPGVFVKEFLLSYRPSSAHRCRGLVSGGEL